jgi:hypothetical protein
MLNKHIDKNTVEHTSIFTRLGEWLVTTHYEMQHDNESQWLLEFNAINTTCAVLTESFRTPGLCIGYLKRMANHSPDRTSIFHIIPWNNAWSIYFGQRKNDD